MKNNICVYVHKKEVKHEKKIVEKTFRKKINPPVKII